MYNAILDILKIFICSTQSCRQRTEGKRAKHIEGLFAVVIVVEVEGTKKNILAVDAARLLLQLHGSMILES